MFKRGDIVKFTASDWAGSIVIVEGESGSTYATGEYRCRVIYACGHLSHNMYTWRSFCPDYRGFQLLTHAEGIDE